MQAIKIERARKRKRVSELYLLVKWNRTAATMTLWLVRGLTVGALCYLLEEPKRVTGYLALVVLSTVYLLTLSINRQWLNPERAQ